MFIYDLKKVVFNIHRMLKPGGVALVTVAGISQISRYDAENWGSYWGFQRDSLKKLFDLQYPVILGIRIEKEMICQQEND